jgi:predicted metal-dependent phosphoesterase TrpH
VPDFVIERLAEGGLRGLEIWHPQHGMSAVRRLRTLARRLDLLETGGSDFHGAGRSVDLGEISVSLATLERLKQAAGVSG